jgi:hypothetical protein
MSTPKNLANNEGKFKMRAEIKVAACVSAQAAGKNKSHNKLYLNYGEQSRGNLKEYLGLLLLSLQTSLNETDRQVYWQQFEITLREYVDLKLNEVQL